MFRRLAEQRLGRRVGGEETLDAQFVGGHVLRRAERGDDGEHRDLHRPEGDDERQQAGIDRDGAVSAVS
jgi:hypothetical protein